MKRIIIAIMLIAAALQAHAVLRQGDEVPGRACRNVDGVEALLAATDQERVISYALDTGSFWIGTNPRQWMVHKGKMDKDGCHKDKYGRKHCHEKQ
uniref:Uncharacterized protein n=1 Tax=Candidatus Kentrum sp. LFY TaxID=2126342 RepID=A0A450V128_9GAMM|nr:MAG: hypothetical protein BECKLFY1418B_GA0070995_11219 [Candidatus Kentron sp. LFY]